MELSTAQVDEIRRQVGDALLSNESLKDDVVDHLCCAVEERMEEGADFDGALQDAVAALAPDGLHEIQVETMFLLNFNISMRMKKIMYTIGLISAMAMCIGWTMNVLHLPGAGNLAQAGIGTFGFLLFAFVFIPMVAIRFLLAHRVLPRAEKVKVISGTLSGVLIALAVVFKILHLPGADQLLLSGAVLLTFVFLPFLFYSLYRHATRTAESG